ncbi:MAG TPA: hypothetical protein VFQ01_01185 [Nocardioides sp.]|jgi:hypothetical protein|nr:hypothetical protein [Nocardioides sp.]
MTTAAHEATTAGKGTGTGSDADGRDARAGSHLERISAAGGVVFVLLLVVDNLVRAGAPRFGVSGETVTAYVEGHRTAMAVPIVLFPLGLLGLFTFVTGVWSASRDNPVSRWWAQLGTLAAVTIAALFSVVNLVEAALVADAHRLAPSPAVVSALWAVDGAAFGLNLAAIGLALLALSRAARAGGLGPRWLSVLAVPGAACLWAASLFAIAIAEGAAWLFLGLAGFLVWALFVLMTSLALTRRTVAG